MRIVFSIVMLCTTPFTSLFWACYLGAGISDILDGFAARKLKQQSAFGAKLDSIADFIFACAIAVIIIVNIHIPMYLWICIAAVALLRFAGYGIGYYKYGTFSALHTYANKTTGAMIFLFPVLYILLGTEIGIGLLCVVAFISASEEVLITIRSQELNRDKKSILAR